MRHDKIFTLGCGNFDEEKIKKIDNDIRKKSEHQFRVVYMVGISEGGVINNHFMYSTLSEALERFNELAKKNVCVSLRWYQQVLTDWHKDVLPYYQTNTYDCLADTLKDGSLWINDEYSK